MKRIALCFLTYHNHEQPEVWTRFIADGGSCVSVYVHAKNPEWIWQPFLKDHVISDLVETAWGRASVVQATLRLFGEALRDPENYKFVLLTQACVPLLPFDRVYGELTSDPRGLIKAFPNNRPERYDALSDRVKGRLPPAAFAKQHANMALSRSLVETALQTNLCEDFDGMESADEHYFINLLRLAGVDFGAEIADRQITYCNPQTHKTQAIWHTGISAERVHALREKGYLFMRKVAATEHLPLAELVGTGPRSPACYALKCFLLKRFGFLGIRYRYGVSRLLARF